MLREGERESKEEEQIHESAYLQSVMLLVGKLRALLIKYSAKRLSPTIKKF